MSVDPKSFNMPDADALGPEQIDDLGRAVLTLTKELCVLIDRQVIVEKLLEDAGIATAEQIDTYQPDDALQKVIDARTSEVVRAVIGELSGVK